MLEQLFHQSPVGFAFIDRDLRYVRINEHLAAINGQPVEAHIGRRIAEVLPHAAELMEPLFQKVFATGEALEAMEVQASKPATPDTPSWWLASIFPVRRPDGEVELVGITTFEITDRKTTELQLQESRERLDLAAGAAQVGVWEWKIATNEMIYSRAAKEICGFDLDQPVTFDMVAAVTHPDDLPHTMAQARRALDPEVRDEEPYEYRLVRPNGEERWVAARGRAVFETEAGVTSASRYVGTLQDITPRKQAELGAAAAAARLSLAMDAARLALWQIDPAGITPSPQLNRILGFGANERPSREAILAGFPSGELDKVREVAQSAFATGTRRFEVEFQYRKPAGDTVWLAVRGEAPQDAEAAYGVVIDITERKKAEEQLLLLTREVDHRANNLLAVVQSIVSLTKADDTEELKQSIIRRVGALARAHELLAMSRWEGIDLRTLVEQELSPFESEASRVLVEGESITLDASSSQALAMVLHELATNAVKHGALSVPAGRLAVRWRVAGELLLEWSERGGPKVFPPLRRGLGTSLLRRALSPFGGETTAEWKPEGLQCRLRLPLAHVRPS